MPVRTCCNDRAAFSDLTVAQQDALLLQAEQKKLDFVARVPVGRTPQR